ncbi:hypothetical protein ACEQ8H_006351 [Pleosporales sp. CAS-2024a]
MLTLRFVALTLGLSAGLATSFYLPTGPTARVKNGTLLGVHSKEYNQDFFLGVPYAQPPVGNLRYRLPASLNQSWSGIRLATVSSSECYGYGSDQWNYPVSEDCLYLNIVRPSGYEKKSLPVAFWIHGGGFIEGGGVDQRYNTSFMVRNAVRIGKPIMTVNINYRLSAWGFLSGSEEVKDEGVLNLGLRDQRLALHWVKENIAAFGGDPNKVTIWGESAGAASVGYHITAFNGRDDKLFRGAMMESGNPINFGSLNDPLANAAMYKELTQRTNCANQTTSPLQCLRDLPAATLNTAINMTSPTVNLTGFMPVLDYDFIAKRTSIQLAHGDFVKVPIIDGANSDEGSAFSPSPVDSTAAFEAYLEASQPGRMTPNLTAALLAAYPDDPAVNVLASLGDARPGPPFGAQFRRSASYFGDAVFIAPRRKTCETWAAAGLDAYCYRFNAVPAGLAAAMGVTHFQEVAWVFDNVLGVGYRPAAIPPFTNKTQSYRDLAHFMDASWVSFVSDLDPNAWRATYDWKGKEAWWPKYELHDPQNMVFDANVSSFAEPDTFRAEGIKLINDNALNVYLR